MTIMLAEQRIRPVVGLGYPDGTTNLGQIANFAANTAWGVQYRVLYLPTVFPSRVTVKKLGVSTTFNAGTGNFDVGIYDTLGNKLVSSGSTAKPATTQITVADVTDTVVGPGLYYLALSNDTTTDTFGCAGFAAPGPAALGMLTETGASVTLPTTATWTVPQTVGFIPWIVALFVTEVS